MNMDFTDRKQSNQMIMEFYETSMNVVLASRIPAFTSVSSQQGKQVNGKAAFSPLIEKMGPCFSGIWEPMIIDIFLLQGKAVRSRKIVLYGSNSSHIEQTCTGLKVPGSDQINLLERWTVHFSEFSSSRLENESFECRTFGVPIQQGISNDRLQRANRRDKTVVVSSCLQGIRTMMTVLLRSLYCTTRLLPAQSLFRSLCCSTGCSFMLDYKISTTPFPIATDLKNMKHQCFTPMKTDFGCMYISVSYQPVAPVPIQNPHMRLSEIISDYADNVSTIRLKKNSVESQKVKIRFSETHGLQDQFFISKKVPEYGEKLETVKTCTASTNVRAIVDENKFECPFAVDKECFRKEGPASSSSISAGVAIASLIALLQSPEPLRGMHEQENGDFLVLGKQKRTANDALRELKLYIDVRDYLKST